MIRSEKSVFLNLFLTMCMPWLSLLVGSGCAKPWTVPPPSDPPGTPSAPPPGEKVTGRLDPAIIQSVIRAEFGRLRACYEEGLRRNPVLEGRIETDFVINRDGTTGMTRLSQVTLKDKAVADCVRDVFQGLRYPPPVGGTVTVGYPIVFSLPTSSQ